MSTFITYKLSESVTEYVDLVSKIMEPRTSKQYIDFLFNLSTQLSLCKYACVNYFAPQLGTRIINALQNTQNKLEDAYTEGEISDEEYEDYKLMIQDAIYRIQEVALPEKSFFFTWIDGEYFGLHVHEDGSLVEDFKYDQEVKSGKKFVNLKDWIDEYKITVKDVEVGVCLDLCEWDYNATE